MLCAKSYYILNPFFFRLTIGILDFEPARGLIGVFFYFCGPVINKKLSWIENTFLIVKKKDVFSYNKNFFSIFVTKIKNFYTNSIIFYM